MRWLDHLTAVRPTEFGVAVMKDGPATLAGPTSAFKPSVDTAAMSVTAILTTPNPDRQGDVIDPTGGDFSEHETNPVVMFHHGKTHKLPIGKAEDKDGNYTVRLVKARDGGDVLIGTTHFAQSSRFAQDVFGLIAEDVLRGVSIGFDPLDGEEAVSELGPSPTLDRSALHFHGWKLLEYSHTPIGVNRDALTMVVHKAWDGSKKLHPLLLKSLEPLADPRRTTVAVQTSAKKTNPAAPAVAKGAGCAGMSAAQRAAVALDKRRKAGKKVPPAPGVRKAMPDDLDDDDDTGAGAPEDDQDAGAAGDTADAAGAADPGAGDDSDPGAGGDGSGYDPASDNPSDDPALPEGAYGASDANDEPPPTVQTLTDGAQGLMDLCAAIEAGMKKSEHMGGRKFAKSLCSQLRSLAAKVSAYADKVHQEVSGATAGPDDGDTADTEDSGDEGDTGNSDAEEAEAEAPETDDEGALVKKGGYQPRRFLFADAAAVVPRVAPTGDVRRLKALEAENKKLRATLDNLLTDIEAADRRGR